MELLCAPFGKTRDGVSVDRYTLREGRMTASVLTYGGILQSLRLPDKNGKMVDIVLGFDNIAAYEQQDKYLGALIGRCANRIAGGAFSLNGVSYTLAQNNAANHLHGGLRGFDRKHWQAAQSETGLTLHCDSPDGEEGYPGALHTAVTYSLADGALSIDYLAQTDADTLCSLTNHTYWNLAGHDSGTVDAQQLRLYAARYTPTDVQSIPTGELAPTVGTPMDFSVRTPIGARWDDNFEQLQLAGGYDHNWVVDGAAGTLRPAAEADSPQSGIRITVQTTQPGMQFYTGNYLDAAMPQGKGGVQYGRRHGFCLETQAFPDAVHHPAFPQPVLRPEQTYRHKTVFSFAYF